jgi:hypothetical protein
MRVVYKPHVRYACYGLSQAFAEPACAHLDGPSIERFVTEAFCAAIQPAQLDALADVLANRQREHERLAQWHRQQLPRARHEAALAHRRYAAVDPDNRLVAAELEQQWEAALMASREAEEAVERFAQQSPEPTLSPEVRTQLLHISQTLPELWANGQLTNEQRKLLLRSLIVRVILTRTAPDRVQVKIVWVSGHFSEGMVVPPIHRQADLSGYQPMVTRIRELWQQGHTDAQIAQTLTAEGFRSARSSEVSTATVLKIRNRHHWVSRYHEHRLAKRIDGMWTIHGLACELGVKRDWFYNRIRSGFLTAPEVIRKPPYGNYLIPDEATLIERLRHEVQRTRRVGAQSQT